MSARNAAFLLVNPTAQAVSERKSAVKESGNGDTAYMRLLLEVHDRRSKLLGLYSAEKHEVSGPDGGPIPHVNVPLDDATQEAILRRHFARMQLSAQLEQAASNLSKDDCRSSAA